MIPVLLVLNVMLGPFHAPDDYDHVRRAYTLAHGMILPGARAGSASGGWIDGGIEAMVVRHRPLVQGWAADGVPDYSEGVGPLPRASIAWTGRRVFAEFPGSASYLPLIYGPQAVALRIGEAVGASVQASVFSARLLNGAAAVTIAAIALRAVPFGSAMLLLLLLLPKTLTQFASNSADPLIIALSLWLLVFGMRGLLAGWRPGFWAFAAAGLAVVVLGGVRPPALLLAGFPLAVAWRCRSGAGSILALLGVGLAAGWFALTSGMIVDVRCGVPSGMGVKALRFAADGPGLVLRTVAEKGWFYGLTFMGLMGWSKPLLPLWAYGLVLGMGGLALWSDAGCRWVMPVWLRVGLLVGAVGTGLIVFFAMYVVCFTPGALVIDGVQGRYFMTSALLLAPLVASVLGRRPGGQFGVAIVFAVYLVAMTGVLAVEGQRLYGWPQF